MVVTCEALDVAALSNFAYPWSAVVDVKAADTLKNQPVGTGPYRLQEWVPQQSLTLAKIRTIMTRSIWIRSTSR